VRRRAWNAWAAALCALLAHTLLPQDGSRPLLLVAAALFGARAGGLLMWLCGLWLAAVDLVLVHVPPQVGLAGFASAAAVVVHGFVQAEGSELPWSEFLLRLALGYGGGGLLAALVVALSTPDERLAPILERLGSPLDGPDAGLPTGPDRGPFGDPFRRAKQLEAAGAGREAAGERSALSTDRATDRATPRSPEARTPLRPGPASAGHSSAAPGHEPLPLRDDDDDGLPPGPPLRPRAEEARARAGVRAAWRT